MNHASRLVLLLALVGMSCLGPTAHGGDSKEVVKILPDLKNSEVQESCKEALLGSTRR